MTRIVGQVVLIAGMAVLPLVFTNSTLDPVLPIRLVVVSGMLAISLAFYAFSNLTAGQPGISSTYKRIIAIAIIVYICVNAASVSWAQTPSESVQPILTALLFGLTVYAFALYRQSDTAFLGRIATALTVVTIPLSMVAILQYFGVAFTSIPGHVIPYSTMANKNLLASALFLLLPCAVCTLSRTRLFLRYTGLISSVLIVFTIVISQTRAVWMALAVSVAATIAVMMADRISIKGIVQQSSFRIAIIFILVSVILGAATILTRSNAIPRSDQGMRVNIGSQSLEQRLALWEKSINLWCDHPALGCGAGNWRIEVLQYGSENLQSRSGEVFFQRPHNDFLWLLAETGPIGALAWIVMLLGAIWQSVRGLRRAQPDSEALWKLMSFTALTGFIVISLFSYPKERVFHSAMLALYVASAIDPRNSAKSITKRTLPIISCILALVCLIASVCILRSDFALRDLMSSRANSDFRGVITASESASSWCGEFDYTSTPIAWYSAEAYLNLSEPDSALKCYNEAYSQNPYHVHVLNNLGAVYEMKGEHESAIRYFTEALAVLPEFEETIINLAAAYYNNGQYDEAQAAISKLEGRETTDPRYEQFKRVIEKRLEQE